MNSKLLKTNQNCLVNGVPTDYVSVQERGLQYGDGLFETIACEGKGLQFWSAHFNRLQQDAKKLGLVCPQESIFLDDVKRLLVAASDNCVVKIILTRGCSQRGYRMIDKNQLTRIIQVYDGLPDRFFARREMSQETEFNNMIALGVCSQKASINPSLAGVKHLNRLENVLARNEWNDEYGEGLMLDANANVIEGTMSNVLAFRDGKLFTPALDYSGVAGVIRAKIIEIAEKSGVNIEIKNLSLDDFYAIDEIFICNSLLEILPVSSINSSMNSRALSWALDKQQHALPETTKLNQLLQLSKAKNVKYI